MGNKYTVSFLQGRKVTHSVGTESLIHALWMLLTSRPFADYTWKRLEIR